MRAEFERIKQALLARCEEIAQVKCPSATYLAALEEIRGALDDWFDASIDAARDDVRRQG